MNFELENKKRIENIESMIKKFLPEEVGNQKTIFEAINYSILAGGKRIRPILMLETYQLFGGEKLDIVEPFITAIEMIHTYSLVHDDLPAMDNDDYRRGRKTTHVAFGEDMAILAGDGLLNLAFEVALSSFENIEDYDGEQYIIMSKRIQRALQVLAKKSGINGMIGGQVCDVQAEKAEYLEHSNLEKVNFIYQLKTSALIEASMMIGAILAGANAREIERIEKIAGNIGLAFQIRDDILDVVSTSEVLGKTMQSDLKNKKTTYISAMSIEDANDEVLKYSQGAIDFYDELNYKNEFLRELILKLVNRKY